MPDIQTRKNHIARTDLINGTLMILRGKLLFAVAILLFYVCSQFVRLFSAAPLCSKPVSPKYRSPLLPSEAVQQELLNALTSSKASILFPRGVYVYVSVNP
jgi:hypothetical protein